MNGGKYEGEKFDRMATKLEMPAPLAKSAILSGVDQPGLGEGQLRADSPLPAQTLPWHLIKDEDRLGFQPK